jgi:hypothetical protein
MQEPGAELHAACFSLCSLKSASCPLWASLSLYKKEKSCRMLRT